MGQDGEKWGKMGKNGGKWGKMGGTGGIVGNCQKYIMGSVEKMCEPIFRPAPMVDNPIWRLLVSHT